MFLDLCLYSPPIHCAIMLQLALFVLSSSDIPIKDRPRDVTPTSFPPPFKRLFLHRAFQIFNQFSASLSTLSFLLSLSLTHSFSLSLSLFSPLTFSASILNPIVILVRLKIIYLNNPSLVVEFMGVFSDPLVNRYSVIDSNN